ncbi:hypothetical protein [Saccharothrix longispora]|uniref:hypothetical protein n=1 Tax=Saccharothrix longispora TaxID=33920 RepID=UPI0028FDB95A|nr:hypothetical protein [Saccharothrix longispora]MBY8847351.1 hypothetical protein [Saccharothrix sp. MB29]MDU0291303.1 hypothetical protein [Saccharothrix longispora]
MSTGNDDLDLTPPQGIGMPAAGDDGWSVAPAVIGGELPEPEPLPPAPPPVAPPARVEEAPEGATKRSFLGRFLRRDG